MAYFGRGAPRRALTAEEEDILTDIKTLTNLNDSVKDWSIPLNALVVIPEGGRRRPLMSITDYRIPKVGGMEPDSLPQSASKRVGKGRSRIPNKIRDRPVNLGLNEEFDMYNRVSCSDMNLPFVGHQASKSDSGYRLPYSLKTDEECLDSSLSVKPKTKMPDFSQFNVLSAANGHGDSLQSDSDGEYSARSHSKANYDRNISVKLGITNGLGDSSHSLPTQSKYQSDQFSDYGELLSSKCRTSSINETLPVALNSSTRPICQNDATENICLPPKTMEINCSLTDTNVSSCSKKDDSCLFGNESSTALMCRPDHVHPSSSNLNTLIDKLDISVQGAKDSSEKSNRQIDSGIPKSKNNLPLEVYPNGEPLLVSLSAHDWWNDPGSAENSESKPPLSVNQSSTNGQYDGQFDAKLLHLPTEVPDNDNCDFRGLFSNQSNRQPPVANVANDISTQQQLYSDCGSKPNLSPNRRTKSKLTSYNHAQEFPSKNGKTLALSSSTQDAQRRPALGWGDTTYRNCLMSAPSIVPAISVHGNADIFSGSRGLNAFMKPIVQPGPVFSMDDDFPALQSNNELNKNISDPTKSDDDCVKWRSVEEEPSGESAGNAIPEEPAQLNNFDQNSIVIENLPPKSEKILREFLEPFVKIQSISLFSTDTGCVAHVRLENDEHCEWLIDCFDGAIPGQGWSDPLKIRKLSSALKP